MGLNVNPRKTNECSPKKGLHSGKLTVRHGKSTILMVFTRKDGIFMGYVSFREGISIGNIYMNQPWIFGGRTVSLLDCSLGYPKKNPCVLCNFWRFWGYLNLKLPDNITMIASCLNVDHLTGITKFKNKISTDLGENKAYDFLETTKTVIHIYICNHIYIILRNTYMFVLINIYID